MSFLGAFDGSNAIGEINKGQKQATGAVDTGQQQYNQYNQQAQNTLNPYAQGGTAGWNQLLNATGVNGPQAQQQFNANYSASPNIDLIEQGVQRSMNAQGYGDFNQSGANKIAASQAWLGDYNNQMNRLAGIADAGRQETNLQSQDQLAQGDTAFGTGQLRAGIDINAANARAQQANTGVNNLLNLAGSVAKMYGGGMLGGMMNGGGGGGGYVSGPNDPNGGSW